MMQRRTIHVPTDHRDAPVFTCNSPSTGTKTKMLLTTTVILVFVVVVVVVLATEVTALGG